MSQNVYRYEGTTFLLIGVQILGWLSILGGIFMFFRIAFDPFAIPFGATGIVGGLTLVAFGSLGRAIIDTIETYQSQLPNQTANQVHQLKAIEALAIAARDKI
jgi:hypothetical protein